MTYKETLDFLFNHVPAYHRIGKAAYKNDLNNIIALDIFFGYPHKKYRTIHIAGTNGKGSVSHIVASVLQEAGYRTGLYTSPHLKDFRERIKVNNEMISEKEVVDFVANHQEIIESLEPSFFELSVAMAFDYFARCKVDVAVIEVGLGGRLDSTNIITPVLSVITNIGHDHLDILGDTLGKIASEKAGIMKKSIPVVISETHAEIEKIFLSKAAELDSLIYFADQRFFCNLEESGNQEGERKFRITDLINNRSKTGETVLGGDYQSKNIQAVYCVFDVLKAGFKISEENIATGIKNVIINTGLQGRWQVLANNPLTICDTGHNKEGLEYVINQIKRIPKSGLHIILGFVNDKDLKTVLPLFPTDAIYYFTKASIPRALDEEILKSEASKYNLMGESYTDVKSALQNARKKASQTDMIFIGGSTFIVAEVI